MTISTTASRQSPFSANPDYARGRADAYDDALTHHPEVVKAHAELALHLITADSSTPQRMYAAGYAQAAVEVMQYHLATKTKDTEKAQKWWARKQGRETSTRHTTHRRQTRR